MRIGKLCISVQGATPAELISRAEAALKDSVFIEFRLDFLPKPPAVLPDIKALLVRRRDITAIATCRRKPYGGKFTGSLNCRARNPAQSRPNRLPHRRFRGRICRAVYPARSWPSFAPPSVPPAPRCSSARTTLPAPAGPRASIRPPSALPPTSPSSSKSSPRLAPWPTISPSCR